VEQVISIKGLPNNKEREKQVMEAMKQLEGQEASSLVVKDPKVQPWKETIVKTEQYEQGGVQSSMEDHQELEDMTSRMANLTTVEEKKKFMRELIMKDFKQTSEVSLEPGATMNLDETYDGMRLFIENDDHLENDEHAVQTWASLAVYQDLELEKKKKEGREKVYRGDPQIWTPLDHTLPQEEHDKIHHFIRDYTTPLVYEEKYGTRRRREESLPKRERPSEYVSLPRKTQYVDDGEKIEY
jgi:hypothetical protein